jgi:response regulator RpfG family c-di-GMP phosphodiesterase
MEKLLLIVDDSKELIEIVENILGELFDRILHAHNAEEAYAKLCENNFSFIILDIDLNGRNGGEVARFLAENPSNQNSECPVFILSGIINENFIEKYHNRFAGVILKPFDHKKLFLGVQEILDAQDIKAEEMKADGQSEPLVSMDEVLAVPCEIPFPLPELEQKVKKVLEGVKKSSSLKKLFSEIQIDRSKNNYLMAHIGLIINISTAICNKMEWNTEKTLEKFVYAAYLHDMALSSRPDLARIHGSMFDLDLMEDKISRQDYKLIIDHPMVAAKKISETPDIPPDVETIVKQHHELPKENGFPLKLSHSKITPLATVFIISHDLTHYILDNPKWILADYVAKARMKFKGTHFAKVLSALSEMD